MPRRCLILLAAAGISIWAWVALRTGSVVEPKREAGPTSREAREEHSPPVSASRAATAPAVREAAPRQLQLRGRVIDRASMAPVAGCRVACCDGGLQPIGDEVKSTSDGAFEVSLQGPDSPSRLAGLVLVVINPTYRVYSQPVPSVPVKSDGTLDIRLEPRLEVGGSAKLTDGTPVVGAKVRLFRQQSHEPKVTPPLYPKVVCVASVPDEYVTKTDSSGVFKIGGLAPGAYHLDLTAKGLLRQYSRNGVLDMRTQVYVPPSRTEIHIILEPSYYFACRPVDSKTGEAIRVAKAVSMPTAVHDAGPELSDIVGLEREAVMKAEGTFVGLTNASRRDVPVEVGFEAAGYHDERLRATLSPLPDLGEWPANLRVVDVAMEADPLRTPTAATVDITGPGWIKEFRYLELFFRQHKSEVNPAPTSTIFDKRVTIQNGQGTIELLPGKYSVSSVPGYRRFKPVPLFEVYAGAQNRLQLSAEDDRVPLRIQGRSPAEGRVPLLYAALRDEGQPDGSPEIMRALPDRDDPYSILVLAPPDTLFRVEVVAAGGPCDRGMLKVPARPSGQTAFQDLEVVMDWAFP